MGRGGRLQPENGAKRWQAHSLAGGNCVADAAGSEEAATKMLLGGRQNDLWSLDTGMTENRDNKGRPSVAKLVRYRAPARVFMPLIVPGAWNGHKEGA